MHNIIVAVEQTISDLQRKWTRFGDNRRVYATTCSLPLLLLSMNALSLHALPLSMLSLSPCSSSFLSFQSQGYYMLSTWISLTSRVLSLASETAGPLLQGIYMYHSQWNGNDKGGSGGLASHDVGVFPTHCSTVGGRHHWTACSSVLHGVHHLVLGEVTTCTHTLIILALTSANNHLEQVETKT